MSTTQLPPTPTGRLHSILDFELEEYDQRVATVRQQMERQQIDVLVIDQFEHLVYLFGYLPTAAKYQACLLPREGEPHMVVRAMDLPVFSHHSWVTACTVFADEEDPILVMTHVIRRYWGEDLCLGLEFDSHLLTVQRYKQLSEGLKQAEFIDFSGFLSEQRLIKSPAEIGYLREAAQIADACMVAAANKAAVGISEREAAAAAYSTAMRKGADNGRVLLSASGELSESIHGRLGQRTLNDGDVLHLEMVPQVRGYSSRLMRPVLIGTHTYDVADAANRLIAIQDEQLSAMEPGVLASEVDNIARSQIVKIGLRDSLRDHTGYTLGLHAQPKTSDHTRIFTSSATWSLEPGMVFHMFLSAKGMAIGETVLITESGVERLTKTQREYFAR